MSENKYDFTLDPSIRNNSHMGLVTRIKPKQRVLELGCSSGYLSQYLAEQLGCQVVGVEMNREALQQAEPFCVQTIVANLDQQDWLTEIDTQKFDVILCADVLEHLKDPASLLKSLQSFLDEDGYVLASVPNVAHASIRLELLQGHFDYESLGLLDDTHLHFYTCDGLVAMFMQAGYLCSDIRYSINDMADTAIDQHLANAGLQATAAARELLHAPEAIAFQYIIEARPEQLDVVQHFPQALSPKPLVSSGVAHDEMHQKIASLEQQLHLQREQYQQQIKHLAIQTGEGSEQADPELTELDNTLFSLSEQLQQQQEKNRELQQHVNHLEHRATDLSADNQRLEQVLQRVHSKLSYRIVRGLKSIPQRFSDLLKPVPADSPEPELSAYDRWLLNEVNPSKQELNALCNCEETAAIAVLLPVYHADWGNLKRAINSVLQQSYPQFELCIAADTVIIDAVRELLASISTEHKKVKVTVCEQIGSQVALANKALSLVTADYICLLGQDDQLADDALYYFAQAIQQRSEAQLIYSDEDKIDAQAQRYQPNFKPAWNPELLLAQDYISRLAVYKTPFVRALKGFDASVEGAHNYDLSLRYSSSLTSQQIIHIPHILYHWNEEADKRLNGLYEKPFMQAVSNALNAKQRPVEVTIHAQLARALRVRYLLPEKLPLVSIIIPTRNGFHLLHRCVESLLARTSYINYELIIIDNGSDDLVTLRYLQSLARDPRIRIMRDNSPFNYSALNNKAVAEAKGECIALLNNDLEIINEDWLNEMLSHALHPEVGAVGAKLYYPNDTIQHAGVIIGIRGVAGHGHKHMPRNAEGYCGRLLVTQNLSAVTAACLVVSKEIFNKVGGFDEQNLAVAFNDVDLCLRIQEQGYSNVWTPYAELYHHESASRGYEDTPEKQARFTAEVDYMLQRWGDSLSSDAAYNPNLTLDDEDFSFAHRVRET